MTRYLCPKCMEVLQDDLSCYFCKGYYTWIKGDKRKTANKGGKQDG